MKLDNETIKKVVVSPEILGDRMRLCSVRPRYDYDKATHKRTNTVIGYYYAVLCYAFTSQPIDIFVPGKQLLAESDYDRLVGFHNLHISIYPSYLKGSYGIEAINLWVTADSVSTIEG